MKTILITGGSNGIGLELAKLFAADGARIVLCAQDEARLKTAVKALPHPDDHAYVVQDLAEPGSAALLTAELTKRALRIDVLVNCAGFGTSGAFATTDSVREAQEMQLNMVTLTELTKLLLPHMVTVGSGHILNVASIAAFMPGPYMAVYYATKAYVLSFSNALHEELRGSGVRVTVLCPGPTATGFATTAGTVGRGAFRGRLPSATDVARAAYDGFKKGKRLVVPGWKFKSMHVLLRFLPEWVVARGLARIQRP